MLAGMIEPHYQDGIGPLLHSGRKEEYVWNIGSLTASPSITTSL